MKSFLFLFLLILLSFGCLSAQTPADEAVLLSNARQLIYEGKRSGEGYFSPDGKKIVFQSERDEENPFYQIYN